MQGSAPRRQPAESDAFGRKLGYFLIPPLVTLVVLSLILAFVVAQYQGRHDGRIFTGVSVDGIDLSGMTPDEARAVLADRFPYTHDGQVVLSDDGGAQYTFTPSELGFTYDAERTVEAAMGVGRSGGPVQRLQAMFGSWYYGRTLSPIIVFDEGTLNDKVSELAGAVNQPALDAAITYNGTEAAYDPGRPGRVLDTADLRQRLAMPLTQFRSAEVEMLVHETRPALYDDTAVATEIQQVMNGAMTFYLAEPLDDADLQPVTLPGETLASWLRVDVVEAADGALRHEVILDENAARNWLNQYAAEIYRDPVRARFYFDDNTRELVLVAPHVNGRELDVEATLDRFLAQVRTSNRAVPFVVNEIVPAVNASATATELGITELITQSTTWFRGSSDARKHNIARAAANFFGIVVAPGEEFSFNHYLGSISEADGYEEGLIIVGGRTIKGIGGGVCQVSTTLYQTAFLGGYPVTERWPHGYMLGYYNDGEGPGMDATVFSPIVDVKFINNTPYHLLIENYYNEEFEALTFKFYSTSLGRTVEKEMLPWENVVPPPEEDVWEYDPDLEPGTVRQIDWATEGADVTVHRTVYNADGDVILDEYVVSNYIPYPNVYHYGPDVEPYDYSLVPPDRYADN